MTPVRTSVMSRSMLPLVSIATPRCSGSTSPSVSASPGSPSEKKLIFCGAPSSTSSKSSGFSPEMGAPCLSVTITEKCTRSTPPRMRCWAAIVIELTANAAARVIAQALRVAIATSDLQVRW